MARCVSCGGVAHPATGSVTPSGNLVCGPCVRRFWAWASTHGEKSYRVGPKGKGAKYIPFPTGITRKKGLGRSYPARGGKRGHCVVKWTRADMVRAGVISANDFGSQLARLKRVVVRLRPSAGSSRIVSVRCDGAPCRLSVKDRYSLRLYAQSECYGKYWSATGLPAPPGKRARRARARALRRYYGGG